MEKGLCHIMEDNVSRDIWSKRKKSMIKMKNMKYFLVLLVLLVLSISVVNASDNTTDLTDHTLEKTTHNTEKVVTSTQEEIQKEDNNINTTAKEKQINKISTTQNTKTATEVDIDNFNDLRNNLTSSDSEDVIINIQGSITLEGDTTVSSDIKMLIINGNNFTINGKCDKQFSSPL